MSKEVYELVGHSFGQFKAGGKLFCPRCGLVALNNDFTRWAVEKGCNFADHPSYPIQRRKYRRLP